MASAITGGTQATVTLTPCPVGVDTTSGYGYQVYLSGGGNSEAVSVMAGRGMHVGSGVGNDHVYSFLFVCGGIHDWVGVVGIQETVNAACGRVRRRGKQPVQCDDSGEWPGYPAHR